MLYTIWNVGDKEYKLRLNAKNAVALEQRLGRHPLSCLMDLDDKTIFPKTGDIITIIHASLQAYEHGISLEDVYDIYDKYIEAGNGMEEIINLLRDIFKTAGFIPEQEEVEEELKNV
jgi:hypothetical protein